MTEVGPAIIGVSLVLCAVFVPAAVIPGLTGQFFKQFAVTIAVSTLLSAFNSLTLSPALTPLLLRDHHAKRDWLDKALHYLLGWWLFRGFNWTFERGTRLYGTTVGWLLRLAVIVLVVYGGLLLLTYLGFRSVPGGFIPQQDQGYLVVNVELPEGESLERTERVMERVANMALETDGVNHTVQIAGYSIFSRTSIPNNGGIYLGLKPFEEREGRRHADDILRDLNAKFATIREARVTAFGAPPILGLGNAGGFKMQIQDKGNLGSETLEGMTWNLAAEATKPNPDGRPSGIPAAFSGFRSNSPQVFLKVDRDRVEQMGVSVQAVNDALQSYTGQVYVNDITLENRTWQVTVQADAAYRGRPEDIYKIKVRGPAVNGQPGEMIPIAGLIKIEPAQGPITVNRYQMYPSADLNGFTIPTLISSGQAIEKMEALAKRDLPPGMTYEWTDIAYQQKQAAGTRVEIPGVFEFNGDTTLLVFGLSVLVAFLVLFGSTRRWLLPLTIVLIVPMCLLCGCRRPARQVLDLNIFVQIGLVVLVGLAAKRRDPDRRVRQTEAGGGVSRFEAAIEASRQRLQPILMTSFAFILEVLPLVTATGAGPRCSGRARDRGLQRDARGDLLRHLPDTGLLRSDRKAAEPG